MAHLFGSAGEMGWVALKALLLYVSAVLFFRLGKRRSLTDLSPFDFIAAVAVGSVVGRVPNAHDASYLSGVVTLAAVLAAHAAVTRLRQFPSVAQLIDHRPRLLVARGRVLEDELLRCGLTRADLLGLLRRQGVAELDEVRFAIFEQRGHVSVIRGAATADGEEPGLVRDALSHAESGGRAARPSL